MEDNKTRLNEKVGAVINTRELAHRCMQLENDLKNRESQLEEYKKTIQRLEAEKQQLARFAEIGENEVKTKKEETINRLRAIVHFSGDQNRLQTIESMLMDDDLSPREIERWHKSITDEFHHLYPTKASSKPSADDAERFNIKTDYSEFQIGNP